LAQLRDTGDRRIAGEAVGEGLACCLYCPEGRGEVGLSGAQIDDVHTPGAKLGRVTGDAHGGRLTDPPHSFCEANHRRMLSLAGLPGCQDLTLDDAVIRYRLVYRFLALAYLLSVPAVAQLRATPKASLRLVADQTAYEPGSSARIACLVSIESGWHLQSHKPTFEYLIPTELHLEVPEGWPQAQIQYPPDKSWTAAFADDEPLAVYDGEIQILARLQVPGSAPPSEVLIEASLRYQACDDSVCLPPTTAQARVELAVGSGGRPSQNELFSAAQQEGRTAPNLGLVLLLAVVGGLILNAMPCVLPVLSLKVFGLVKAAGGGRSQVVVGALATAAGILFSFWALALAAVAARSAGSAVGWGIQFQRPGFVAFLAVVVVLFCLNLWGLFEIQLPGALAQVAGSGPREGVAGHFTSGLFATLMATPCSAPFLGTAVGFALGQPAAVVFAVFTAVAVGMALPYLALAAAPQAARLLPRPGDWMLVLRGFMGFLLAGAVVWLLYVLASQVSRERLALLQMALLVLALLTWLRQVSRKTALRRLAALGVVVVAVLTVVLASSAATSSSAPVAREGGGLIQWIEFDRRAAEELASRGRLVFVDVTADWCVTCKVNERLVLETPEVAEVFQRHQVVAMKADWTTRNDEVGRYLADFGRYGIPFYLLYRPEQEPFLFSELLSKERLIAVVDESGRRAKSLEGSAEPAQL
jgi:thiol:disulfide interchange protein